MSPINYAGNGKLKTFPPTIGNSVVIHIRDSKEVRTNGTDKDNFRSQDKNWGYRFELTLTNDRLFLLNNWTLFFAFKEPVNAELDANGDKVPVQDGDKIQIDHVGTKDYRVTILERGTGLGVVVPDVEKEEYNKAKRAEQGTPPVATTQAPPVQATPPVQQTLPPAQATPPVQQTSQPEEELDLPF